MRNYRKATQERNKTKIGGAIAFTLLLAIAATIVAGLFQSPMVLFELEEDTCHYGVPLAWHGNTTYNLSTMSEVFETMFQYQSYMFGFALNIAFWFVVIILFVGAVAAISKSKR